jgi:cell wall-associated NlpC family hydrolase
VRFPVYDGYTPRHASSGTARQVGTSEHGHGTYTVRQGDTLAKVAARFGVSLPVLQRANPHVGPHWIYPGESVTVPTGENGDSSGQVGHTATHTSESTEVSTGAGSPAHEAAGGQLGARIVAQARRFVAADTPYKWGGESLAGADCSGLVQTALAGAGVSAPRTAAAQQAWAVPVSSPAPGDLGFFGSPAHHVVMYAGDGMIVEESTPGTRAHIRAVYGSPQWERVP